MITVRMRLFLLVCAVVSCSWVQAGEAVITRGPYVQMGAPSSMSLIWRTDCERITPIVRYGTEPDHLFGEVSGKAVLVKFSAGKTNYAAFPALAQICTRENLKLPRLHSSVPGGTFQYETTLSGLQPNTRYYYAVYDGAQRLTPAQEDYSFWTSPPTGQEKAARFWVVGDSGTARKQQHMVYQAALRYAAREGRPFDFALHVGDIAYMNGTDMEFQTRHFNMYPDLLRNTVCWTTPGNHEGYSCNSLKGIGPYYDAHRLPTKAEAGGVLSGIEAYYSFDWGRIHFVSLDSFDMDRKTNGPMALWLKKDLAQAKTEKNADWLIAFFHHPPYTKGSHDGDKEKETSEMRTNLMAILENGGVDMVFAGHSHTYERSMLFAGAHGANTASENVVIDEGDGNPQGDGPYLKSAGLNPGEGVVHVVTGHGGTTLSRKGTLAISKFTYIGYGSMIVDVNGDTLVATMVDNYGSAVDQFSIVKRGKAVVARLPVPWQPPEHKQFADPKQDGFPIMLPLKYSVLIPPQSSWQYLAGNRPRGRNWTWLDFEPKGWKSGQMPFGYKYEGVNTLLDKMQGNYATIYTRKEFTVERPDRLTDLALMIDYDDAFIAYLNGVEVARRGVERGSGGQAQKLASRDAGGYSYISLNDFKRHLKSGRNVLSIEGHNNTPESSDFLVDAYLVAED